VKYKTTGIHRMTGQRFTCISGFWCFTYSKNVCIYIY